MCPLIAELQEVKYQAEQLSHMKKGRKQVHMTSLSFDDAFLDPPQMI